MQPRDQWIPAEAEVARWIPADHQGRLGCVERDHQLCGVSISEDEERFACPLSLEHLLELTRGAVVHCANGRPPDAPVQRFASAQIVARRIESAPLSRRPTPLPKCPGTARKLTQAHVGPVGCRCRWVRGRVRLVRTMSSAGCGGPAWRGSHAAQGLIRQTGSRPCSELVFCDEQPTEGMR